MQLPTMKNLVLLVALLTSQIGLCQSKMEAENQASSQQGKTLMESKVDSVMQRGIHEKAFPGAQVLVAKNNEIVFHKTYGFHTYDSIQAVAKNDIYDLASVTKILGPLPALMKLVDEGKLDLDAPFSTYWTSWRNVKDKKDLTLREILSHQAGLIPYIIFLDKVTKQGKPKRKYLRNVSSNHFSKQVYDSLFISDRYQKKMYRIIKRSKVSDVKKYRYSGLSFLIYPELITRLTGMDYETYLQKTFYTPLNCQTLGFNPETKRYPNKIVPTEIDTLFRKTLVRNWVHDENAALMGGVSGNAGLFGSADDLAKMLLFYQNMGQTMDGNQLISRKTVAEFTKIQYPENENRRGLGFDKPLIGNDTLALEDAYPSPKTSAKSFGHAGFTGTFVWADPENQLVFIFLSNRVHPYRTHRKLYELNIRTSLQDIFYDALVD